MLTNKRNVLELVALLKEHGVSDVVLCPGSRNVPLVQTMSHLGWFNCYPVTDERSAGFFALGLALRNKRPAVVCCTSGTALLNIHPAVAEAYYQQVPLIVISADRPEAWIGQMDGQTLVQPGVFGNLSRCSVQLPMGESEEEMWHCNRLINEALLATGAVGGAVGGSFGGSVGGSVDGLVSSVGGSVGGSVDGNGHRVKGPVHINVPVNEPLFDFSVEELPKPRVIRRHAIKDYDVELGESEEALLSQYKRRMLIIGQGNDAVCHNLCDIAMRCGFVVVSEHLANLSSCSEECNEDGQNSGVGLVYGCNVENADLVLREIDEAEKEELRPDLVITVGGHIVSKKLKQYLRKYRPSEHWHVSKDGAIADLFCCQTLALEGSVEDLCHLLEVERMKDSIGNREYCDRWRCASEVIPEPDFDYSAMAAVGALIERLPYGSILHLANSSAVRYAQLYRLPQGVTTMCNRGTSGIEGSLSTAVGYASLVGASGDNSCNRASGDNSSNGPKNFILIGDLSFFYDMNALWNLNYGSNLRIVVLNNGGGEIFRALPGLNMDDEAASFITASHGVSARSWAEDRGFRYYAVHSNDSSENHFDDSPRTIVGLEESMDILVEDSLAPILVEVFTDATKDTELLKQYYNNIKHGK